MKKASQHKIIKDAFAELRDLLSGRQGQLGLVLVVLFLVILIITI